MRGVLLAAVRAGWGRVLVHGGGGVGAAAGTMSGRAEEERGNVGGKKFD